MTTPGYGIVTPPQHCLTDCHARHAVLIFAAAACSLPVYTGGVCWCLQMPLSAVVLCSVSAHLSYCGTWQPPTDAMDIIQFREAGTGWDHGIIV